MAPKCTTDITVDKASVKMLLRAVEKYGEKKVFGSPVEQETFNELKWQLHTALYELQFKCSP